LHSGFLKTGKSSFLFLGIAARTHLQDPPAPHSNKLKKLRNPSFQPLGMLSAMAPQSQTEPALQGSLQ
jgi:hypothetical protein